MIDIVDFQVMIILIKLIIRIIKKKILFKLTLYEFNTNYSYIVDNNSNNNNNNLMLSMTTIIITKGVIDNALIIIVIIINNNNINYKHCLS